MKRFTATKGVCRYAAAVLRVRVGALAAERAGVRQADDIECVHRMRVASRRLRAALDLFAGCLPARTARAWGRGVRRVTRALGAARDTDVQIEAVEGFAAGVSDARVRPGVGRLLLRLHQRREAEQGNVTAALNRLDADRLLDEMDEALARLCPAATEARPTPALWSLAAATLTERLDDVLAYAPAVDDPERAEELHALRIAVKRLRYTLEIFAPLDDETFPRALKTTRALQAALGDLHDCDVWLATLPTLLDDERRRALEYAGHARDIARLEPGLRAFTDDRRALRAASYRQFHTAWHAAPLVWDALRAVLAAGAQGVKQD